MDELFEKMQKLVAEKLEIDEAKITLDSSFRNDLGADSLDTYELVYAIEEELHVSIQDEKGGIICYEALSGCHSLHNVNF